ncbi:MAG: ABC transporter ATP-binding protein [Bacilli bacterium]|nr:ABC transporter ATP-binding protein [Bacilli bacterium]
MKETVKVKQLSYNSILDNISLTFYENSIHYISGSNNCGKSTLMKILNGDIISSNQVFYQGKDINTMSCYEFSKMVGEVLTLDKEFSFTIVKQEILYQLDRLNFDRKEHLKRYQEVVTLLQLKEEVEKSTLALNDYEKLKLLVALQLVKKPKILLLGNIFTYITKKKQEEFMVLLKKIKNLTVIISSNDLSSCLYSDYLHLFHKGKLILSGKTMEVLRKDSIINKLGLDLPFMVDLSLKLQYYNLLEDIELDMNGMVQKLWK